MTVIDVNAIEAQARKETSEELTKVAVGKLKDLLAKREKALLVVRNIDREIEVYKADIVDNAVYANSGIELSTK